MYQDSPRTYRPHTTLDVPEPPLPQALERVHAPHAPMLRIALLSYRSAPLTGGQGIYIRHLSKALADLGHQVTVLSGPPYPDLCSGIELVKLPSLDLHAAQNPLTALHWRHCASPTDLYEWISHNSGKFPEPYTFGERAFAYLKAHRHRFDVIHDNQSLGWGILRLRRLGLPVTATIHHPITKDRDIAVAAANRWGLRLLIKRWHSFVDMQAKVARKLPHIITVSRCTRHDVSQAFGVPLDKMHVVHNGVDTAAFQPARDLTRHPHRLIATASADIPLKGLTDLLDAFALLLPRYPGLELRIVGSLREGHTARRLDALRIRDKVTFISGISEADLVREYATATLAVCPSVYEGFGFPAAEAMSCGTPLVSTDGGALPEVVGDAGLIVPVRNPARMAEAIAALLDDPALRDRLGRMGRTRMVDRFDWKTAALAYEAEYRRIICDQSSPP